VSTQTEQRKLAAIMFTDMVGYSALSQRDDKLALELLEEHRRILREIFPHFHGTEIKTIGDAFLVEFNSALEAAQCAIEIQRALVKRNADVPPDRRIELKIGIHIGDVVHRGGDVYGDGVNIASRIEPLAGAGGICVSMDVERQIRNALDARFEKLAPTELKNISVTMDLFRIVLPWEQSAKAERKNAELSAPSRSVQASRLAWIGAIVLAIVGAGWWLAHQSGKQVASSPRVSIPEKSIAVLPLVNTSGDPGNDYFSDGLSEELIAVLAKIPGLKIIGRSSSFLFKGKSEDSRMIGEKLGVANLLEGSVRKQGERVRIVAELINAVDGRELWSDTYDRELKDVFAVQSEIAVAVTDQLKIKLLGASAKSDAAPSNDNLAAYNALQQGTFYLRLSTEEGTRKATEFYGEAIRLDPNYALAHANLSSAWRQLGATWLGGTEANEAYAKGRNEAHVALSLAPNLSAAHEALGFVLLTPDLDFAGADAEFRKAEKLAPADAAPKNARSYSFAAEGRLAEAENLARQALTLDPLGVTRYLNLARILIGGGRHDEAEAALGKARALQPAAARQHVYLTIIDILRGNTAAALQDAELEPPGFWRDYAVALAAQGQSDRPAADAALQKLIHEDAVNGPFQIAAVYGLRKEPDKMFEWLDRAYTARDSGLTQLLVTPFILTYKNDPRFAAFCQKLKLPVPTTVVTKP
jgi:TolB-like protein/class 3 adenylate cyclase/Flp pilus assembly protein TadD